MNDQELSTALLAEQMRRAVDLLTKIERQGLPKSDAELIRQQMSVMTPAQKDRLVHAKLATMSLEETCDAVAQMRGFADYSDFYDSLTGARASREILAKAEAEYDAKAKAKFANQTGG